ncbi:hypothetical protein EDB89DRAFT_744523 [Lactarius sanguifluus]|nr:hypothetical protein EDB89DRAFT_744523 [Lactarius sanguifluus]
MTELPRFFSWTRAAFILVQSRTLTALSRFASYRCRSTHQLDPPPTSSLERTWLTEDYRSTIQYLRKESATRRIE